MANITIKEALKSATDKLRASNSPSAYLDAEVLLLHAIKGKKDVHDKSWIYINSDYDLSKKESSLFFYSIKKRCLHEPVAYIIGEKEFYGYNFFVNENTLIPRSETETIVSEALKIIGSKEYGDDKFSLLDIGTGSGCIIISILNELAKMHKNRSICSAIANDISKKALEIAEKNSRKYKLNKKIIFLRDDFSAAFRQGSFDRSNMLTITANLPYIRNDEYDDLHDSVKYEPKSALIGGKDGLRFIKRLIHDIKTLNDDMKNNIILFLESDPKQINMIKELARGSFPDCSNIVLRDLSKKRRFVKISLQK